MKKKNKIIIAIVVILIAIIVVIVGITVNNHQKAVKEAEAISVSVETSKNDLISDYQKRYKTIISAEYKTEAEYDSAKKSLSALKDEIVKSDVKDNETIISLVKDIDNRIKDYDDKINSLTTTETTTEEITEKVTEKESSKVNKTTTKSNNDSNSNTEQKPKPTKETVTETTTNKKLLDPPYGTVYTSKQDPNKYKGDFTFADVTFTWLDGRKEWYVSDCSCGYGISASEVAKLCSSYHPDRNGNYQNETVERTFYIYVG